MKYTETTFLGTKQILKFPDHYVAIPVTVDDTGVVANADGKKLVLAGTILGGGVLADNTIAATTQNDADAEGVLLTDVDVTYGPKGGALVVHGFIDKNKIPAAPDPAAVTAIGSRILFL